MNARGAPGVYGEGHPDEDARWPGDDPVDGDGLEAVGACEDEARTLDAVALGAVSQISLLLSGLFATWVFVPSKVVGWLAGLGAGALISAVTFDLTEQAETLGGLGLAIWLLVGAAVFIAGDLAVDRRFGSGSGSDPLGIVLGSVVDGVPESLIFGIGVAAGNPVSLGFLGAVIVSNVPQALAPSAELAASGWSRTRLSAMWGSVVLACGIAAGIGYLLGSIGETGDAFAAFAAGGLLAMLTDSLVPFAYSRGGSLAGLWTVVGFALAVVPGVSR
jgi:ZIP family zinc transporter